MVSAAGKLAALERIARLKAERELKAFAAFKAHMTALEGRAQAMHVALRQSYDSAAPLSVGEARIANAQAGRSARELRQAERDIAALTPRFDIARAKAAREFGRAEVLATLRDRQQKQDRQR
ncbi:hypothetical protein JJJ17_03585 [Paracoccus caeni]|uniref:Uncharacterized protein n=1 Tax=Paracoccus caeni TaxID=657651 RepID=A0A934SC46_9RHOB|nr:hypothetical protein [Paracoccus caeni]MBK4215003.1 hypothetical protein [Paracoccus caeni]